MINCDIIVVGAGASGLAAAFAAAQRGQRVIVLERNDTPAKKLLATGNGRCNFSNRKAMFSAELVGFFSECLGIEAVEEDGRFYPRSFEAKTVADALVGGLEMAGAQIICGAKVVSVSNNEMAYTVRTEDGRFFLSKAVILATGGKAGIQFGCYGDGYKLAEKLGHSIVKPVPALDALTCAEDLSELHGVRVRAKVSLQKSQDGGAFEEAASEEGEVQFTKTAVSGICVMDLSGKVRLAEGTAYRLVIDLFPEKKLSELEYSLSYRQRMFGVMLKGLVPEKLAQYIENSAGKDPAACAAMAKALTFTVTGTKGWKNAQVTCGGVPLSEVDGMFRSKASDELYIVGELLDYDGPCGGFNLNWAFHTGLTAGMFAVTEGL
ncbi:MAG: aminoacetone oxidase family FAD-binding enzyme [Firmicutes bacterium]|nr:aminoacetone oxidase family FAD-binding enzyme [Bacillota bacterium]